MIWWWELGYKDEWAPDSVIKSGCEVNISRSIHEEEDFNICAGSLITWCKSILPATNLNLNYFWTACSMNLKLYDFSWLLQEIILFGKKIQKNIKLSRGNIFLYRVYCQKIGVRICKNSFSCRIKYLHVWEVVNTSSFNLVKRLRSIFCWPAITIYGAGCCKL